MALLIVRHGETALNVARTVQPADTPLSERGWAQARLLADRLAASQRVVAIVSSDLPRAAQTAQAVAARLGLPLHEDARLQERNFGRWRGLPYDGLGFDPLRTEQAPPDGESLADFRHRVALAFDRLRDRLACLDGDLLVVTHGLVFRALFEQHLALAPGQIVPEHLANTSLTVVGGESGCQVALAACAAHLAGEQAPGTGQIAGI